MNFFSQARRMAEEAVEQVEDAVEDAVDDVVERDTDGEEVEETTRKLGEVELQDESEFEQKAKLAIPGLVRMISGCADSQTSADVSNTAGFELPEDSGPGGAGGAATCSLLASLFRDGQDGELDLTWVQLLDSMRNILNEKSYTQIPQMSSSRKEDIQHEKVSLVNLNESSSSKRRALLVGINYVGQRGELNGCHNDVLSMKDYIAKHGFQGDNVRVLLDNGEDINPTRANIQSGIDWLLDGAEEGDSLFFHYSGHGGYVEDANGDESDGRDETLVPVDFASSGQITDDDLFQELVMPVPKGVQLTVICDCCHSGTVLDLPYCIKASAHLEGTSASMSQNPGFNYQKLFKLAKKLYDMRNQGASKVDLAKTAATELMPMIAGAAAAPSSGSSSTEGKPPSGGLANMMSMFGGAASGGSAGGLPSLPF